jgi:hypothetical protein
MPLYRALVSIPYFTNVPEDVSTNTLYFAVPEGTSDAVAGAAIDARLDAFYQAIDQWYSPVCSNNAGFKLYRMDDPEPRQPVYLGALPLSVATGQGSPEENAIVLSFQADAVSGANQASRRGRIYLGPFAQSAFSVGTTSAFSRVNPATITTITAAAVALANTTTNIASWCVYSQKLQQFYFVKNGWVDFSVDTQRRRGGRVPGRTTWTAP